MRNPAHLVGIVTLVLVVASPVLGQEASPVGHVKVVGGSAFILREGVVIPARLGQAVFEADGLSTAADGRIGVTLRDNTRVSLGASSEIRLSRFVYAPAEGRVAFVLRVARGVMAYVSGQIAELSPDAVRLETPAAILGVRGTNLVIRVEPS